MWVKVKTNIIFNSLLFLTVTPATLIAVLKQLVQTGLQLNGLDNHICVSFLSLESWLYITS